MDTQVSADALVSLPSTPTSCGESTQRNEVPTCGPPAPFETDSGDVHPSMYLSHRLPNVDQPYVPIKLLFHGDLFSRHPETHYLKFRASTLQRFCGNMHRRGDGVGDRCTYCDMMIEEPSSSLWNSLPFAIPSVCDRPVTRVHFHVYYSPVEATANFTSKHHLYVSALNVTCLPLLVF
jgi:hypothetical protein